MNHFRIVLAGVLALVAAGPAFAAVTANSVVTAQTPNRGIVQFLQGTDSAGTYKTLYSAGTNGSICKALVENNNDASATHLVTVQIVNAAVKYGAVAVVSGSNDGFASGTPPKNLMSPANWIGLPVDSENNPFFVLASGDTLQATFATALTAADVLNLYTVCYDY